MKRFVGVLVFLSYCLGSFPQNDCPLGDWDDVVVFCTDENDLGIKYPASRHSSEDFCFFSDLYRALMDSADFSTDLTFHSLSGVVGCLGGDCIVTPRWLLMQVEESGDLTLELTHSMNSDVDYACWGPFWGDTKNDVLQSICEDPVNSLSFIPQYRLLTLDDMEACPRLYELTTSHSRNIIDEMLTQVDNPCFRGNFDQYPYLQLQDCSFSYQYTEICRIEQAVKGGWYLFLVSNYGRMMGDITIRKLGGSAIVSCKVIVDISNSGPYCEGDDIHLKVLNAPQNATFSWIGPNGFSSTEKEPVIPNSTVENAGVYSLQMVANGVASDVVETNVIVRPSVAVDTTIMLDYGDSYQYGDSVYTETGVHTEIDASNPCGVKNVHLFFSTPELHLHSNSPICEGEVLVLSAEQIPDAQYDWIVPSGQRLQNQSHELSLPNVGASDGGSFQLDLIIHADTFSYQTVVDVHKKQVITKSMSVVVGDSVEFDGKILRQAGDYQGVFLGQNGCDSVVLLHLDYYLPEITLVTNSPVCEGEALRFSVKSAEQIPDAQYDWVVPSGQRLQNQSQEWVLPDVEASDGGSYQLDLIIQSDTLSYQTEVEVHKKQEVVKDTLVVAGDSVEFAGKILRQAGDYQGVFQGQNGCDSVVTLHLDYYLPEITLVTNAPVCEGEALRFSVKSAEQIPDAQYDWVVPSGQRLQNQSQEWVLPDVEASDGGSYQLDLIIQSDTFSYQTVVDVRKKQVVTKDTSVVAGDSVEFAGKILRQAGDYQGVFQGQNGCDSVVTLHLDYYLPKITLVTNAPVCEGGALHVSADQDFYADDVSWSGPNGFVSHEKTLDIPSATLQNSGQYKLTITCLPNLVSEATIDVQVLEKPSIVLYDTIMFGEQYEFDGRSLQEDGEYMSLTTSQHGCDSVTRLMLKVVADSSLAVSYDPYYCYGSSFSVSVVDPQEFTEYSWTGPNHFSAAGASIRIENAKEEDGGIYVVTKKQRGEVFSKSLSINVAPRCAYDTMTEIEYGESVDFNGKTIDQAGRYETVLTNAVGCDSFITLTVVCTLPSLQLISNSPVCEGEELVIQADGKTDGASIEWIGPNGFTSDQKRISIPNVSTRNQGEYKFVRKYADTLVETSVMALVREKYREDVDVSIPKGDVYDFGGESLSMAGDYEKTFISRYGCDSVVTVHLTVVFPDTSLNILTDNPYCSGETIRLKVEPPHDYAEYKWNGPQHFHAVGPEVEIENASEYNGGTYHVVMTVFDQEVRRSVEVDVHPTYVSDTAIIVPYGSTYDFHGTHLGHSGIYQTTLLSSDGCDSTIYLDLTVLDFVPLKPAKYFTPNGDGVNERWVIENVERYGQVEVTIFDRYGTVVRHYDHYENLYGWDGKDENGFDKPSADYWYIISSPYSQEELSGNFSLIRR